MVSHVKQVNLRNTLTLLPSGINMDQYEGTFHGGEGGRPTLEGGQNSGPRRSPELIENSFSDKSAMAKRLELVPGPGDFQKHGFRAILGAQKSPKKIHTF